MKYTNNWINGKWLDSASGDVSESINPANGEVLGTYSAASKTEAEMAINAARNAFEKTDWCHTPRIREKVLLEFADRIEAETDNLTALLTAENGKLLAEARPEVLAGISEARYYAGLSRNIFGRVTEIEPSLYSILSREPLGVAGIIVPWNAPIALLLRSLAPAMAAGCASVIKSAPQTALFSAELFRILSEVSDLPDGIVNMFVEDGSDGAKEMVASPEVDIISYTGSTDVGKQIMAAGAPTLTRMNLELGGNAPIILLADVDLTTAVPAIVRAGMNMTGQYCCSACHIMVHESRLDETLSRFKEQMNSVVVGPGIESHSQMGPMINNASRDRVINLVASSQASDEIIIRGEAANGRLACGSFLTPSLIQIKDSNSTLYHNEIFGPVLCINTFSDEDDAVFKANNTRFGLAASVWTKDLFAAQRVANRIKSGNIWINSHGRLFSEIENGGYKESGIGRLHGVEGLAEFMQTKHISWSTKKI